MANHGKELSSIDFGSMIGGPLDAAIEAQAKSAITTVDFIKQVGFKDDAPVYVSFNYNKLVDEESEGDNGNILVSQKEEEMELKVPILTMLPIPFIRIEEMTIDFNAKINSMSKNTTSSSFTIGGEFEAKQKWLGGSAKLSVSASYKKQRSSTSETKKTYSLAIHVKAVQDEMPAGMERILNILEENITSTPKNSGS